MNPETLSNTDRTSWSRVAMVWRFYLPYTRKKLLFFCILTFLVQGMMMYAYKNMPAQESRPMLLMLSVFICGLMVFSPLVFAKPKGRELQTLLPALGMEKCIVIIGYVTLIIPLLVNLPSIIVASTCGYFEAGVASLFGLEMSPQLVVYSYMMLEAMALTCLWGVLASKRKYAMRNGILGVGAFYLAVTFCSGFISGLIAGIKGYSETLVEENLTSIYSFLSIICGIYIIFALIKCCRIIKHGI